MSKSVNAFLFAAILLSSIALRAQTDINALIAAPKGTPQIPVRFGSVNLNTGNLHLDIPLVSMSERGSGPSTMSLRYDSMFWLGLASSSGPFSTFAGPIYPPYTVSYWKIASSSGLEAVGTAFPYNYQTESCQSQVNGAYGTIETYQTWGMIDS